MREKQLFQGVGGFATTKGKRVFVSSELARAIGWPWSESEVVRDLVDEGVVEVFDYNGRPLNGLSHLSMEFGLIFSDTLEVPATPGPLLSEAETQIVDPIAILSVGPFPKHVPFTSIEALRRLWRLSLSHPAGPFSLAMSGVVTSGKWKPNGRAKAWIAEPIEFDLVRISCVKTSWIFLEGDFFAQILQPGAIIVVDLALQS